MYKFLRDMIFVVCVIFVILIFIVMLTFVVCYCEGDFKVHVVPSQSFTQVVIVKLQSVKTPSSYLAIRGGNVHGKVGEYCDNIDPGL